MARSLIGALVRSGACASDIAVAEPNADLRKALAHDFGVNVHAQARAAAEEAETIVLAVKPQVLKAVCAEIAEVVAAQRPLLISIAAGVRTAQLQTWLGGEFAIVRAMPNTPALIGAGASGMIANAATSAAQRAQAEAILGAAGSTAWIAREELMDTVTALSGSGPAYFFLLVEALEGRRGCARPAARDRTCIGHADLPWRRTHAGRGRRSAHGAARTRDLARRHHRRGTGCLRCRRSARTGERRRGGRDPSRPRTIQSFVGFALRCCGFAARLACTYTIRPRSRASALLQSDETSHALFCERRPDP